MSTTKHDRPGAVAGQVDCRVRLLRKATIDRLCRVLDEWMREEQNLCSHYGPPADLPSGCFRSKRIKDAEALQQTLAYLQANRPSARERPNVELSGAPAGHSSNHPAGGASAGKQG